MGSLLLEILKIKIVRPWAACSASRTGLSSAEGWIRSMPEIGNFMCNSVKYYVIYNINSVKQPEEHKKY